MHGHRPALCSVLAPLVILVIVPIDPAFAQANRFEGAPSVRYHCDDGREVLATFVQAEPPAARIEGDGRRWILSLGPSASGARYSDGSVTFWEQQGTARLELDGRAVTCRRAS